ncbi:MAG: response regulator [Pseudomonadota bacterium]
MTSKGFEVEVAEDGHRGVECVRKLGESRLRAIFLDVLMPEINGLDVLVQLKTSPETQNIPVIVLTTEGMMEDMIKGYQMGADYYIPKPFTQEQLLYGLESI